MLEKRIVTVGETKTSARTGRTIPMNDDRLAAAIEYSALTFSPERLSAVPVQRACYRMAAMEGS